MAFKMKGWGGYQGSPMTKNGKGLADVQKNIKNFFEGLKIKKPSGTSPGFGLTAAEKKEAKRRGMSEYQWKTGANITGEQHHHRRQWQKKHGFSWDKKDVEVKPEKEDKEVVVEKEPIIEPSTEETEEFDSEEVDYGTGFDYSDWSKESTGTHPETGDPWNLHSLVKYRDQVIKTTFGTDSEEFDKIQKVINKAYKEKSK